MLLPVLPDLVGGQVKVMGEGGLDGPVSHESLNREDISPVANEVAREGVAEHVAADVALDASPRGVALHHDVKGRRCQRAAVHTAWKQRVIRPAGSESNVVRQVGSQRLDIEEDDAVSPHVSLAALACDRQGTGAQIHVSYEKAARFGHPDAGCQQEFEDDLVAEGGETQAGMTDRDRLKARIEKDRTEAAAKLERERQATARAARALYAKAQPCNGHPYLTKKGVDTAPGLRVLADVLLVPRFNIKGEIISLVRIWANGTKKNLPGATYPGGFFAIKGTDGPLLICEGLSTGLSLHMATGATVLCAFDCGNLLAVAQGARGAYPEREIVICGDQDGPDNGNPGMKHANQAAQAVDGKLAVPSIPDRHKLDFNDVHLSLGLEAVKGQVQAANHVDQQSNPDQWAEASAIFPRVPMPWDVFPDAIVSSIKQLARSCACSPLALAGLVLAIMAACVGRLVSVSPKLSWLEPLIFWFLDLRDTGEGKTPPQSLLVEPLVKVQRLEHARAKADEDAYKKLSRKQKEGAELPLPARGYLSTDQTLEGLRDDMRANPNGGLLVLMSEASAFITSQNQFKGGKGSDRESWLALYDGKAARTVRAGTGKTVFLEGTRFQIYGGTQTIIFEKIFGSDDGIYTVDGTVNRFLVTHEPPAHFDLTPESWSSENRKEWEIIVERALKWADDRSEASMLDEMDHSLDMMLSSEAQNYFFEWRNDIYSQKHKMPRPLRGYVPKTVGYALRLAARAR